MTCSLGLPEELVDYIGVPMDVPLADDV